MATITEQETTQGMESLFTGTSSEAGEVSEQTESTQEEATTAEAQTETTEVKTEAQDSKEQTPEMRQKSEIQAAVDKQVNKYREVREADTAMIRKLNDELKTLRRASYEKETGKQLARLQEAYDDEGMPEEKKETFTQQVKKINAQLAEYNANVQVVEEAATFVSELAQRIPETIVRQYKLDDPNPNVRARNGVELLESAASVYTQNQNFSMVVEAFFPKGGELRKQLEDIAAELNDTELNTEKAKRLHLAQRTKGLNVTPKKSPPSPSGTGGGIDWSKASAEDKLMAGLAEERKKHKL